MVDQIAVVTFTTPAATGLLSVTSPLITEAFSAALLIFTREESDGTDNSHAVLGYGFIAPDGATPPNASICIQIDNSSTRTTPDANTVHDGGGGANALSAANGVGTTLVIGASYNASVAGGVQLNFTVVNLTGGPAGGPVRAKCTAILFAGLARAHVNQCTSSVGGTAEAVGDTVNFRPDLVFFSASDAASTTNHADGLVTLGVAIDRAGAPQVSSYINFDDATEPTDADGVAHTAKCYSHQLPIVARTAESVTCAITATGFTLTSSAGSPDANYLALKFTSSAVRLACAQHAVAAATGPQAFNAFTFTPDLVVGMVVPLAAADSQTDGPTASAGGYFVTGRYGSRAYTVHAEEGKTVGAAASFNTHTRQEDVALLLYNHTGTIIQRATWTGASGAGGFILDFSVASAVSRMMALGIQLQPQGARKGGRRPRKIVTRAAAPRAGRASVGRPGASRLHLFRAWFRRRAEQLEALFYRRPPIPNSVPEPEDVPEGAIGDSAMGGSDRGSNAQAGSEDGATR